MVNQTRSLDFLPEIFRTEVTEQFLGKTLDVLTSKPDLIRTEGFIGENYGYSVLNSDKYVVESSSDRANYQLSPAVVMLKENTQTARDFIDYPNIIRALGNRGALTDNHNRLFANEFYSWDSFVDLDKLINYGQYYWLPLGPDAISITSTTTIDINTIIGQKQYTSSNGVPFVNGLKVKFTTGTTPALYNDVEYYVEGVGESIQLIPVSELKVVEPTAGSMYLPWADYKTGWSSAQWDVDTFVATNVEYILINRASTNRNAWSRTNRWFNQRVLDITKQFNGVITSNASNILTRASRPIVEFYSNLALFDSGTTSAGIVDFVDTKTKDPFSALVGKPSNDAKINADDPFLSVSIREGAKIIFAGATDPLIRANIYTVNFISTTAGDVVSLAASITPIVEGSLAAVIAGPAEYTSTSVRAVTDQDEFSSTYRELIWELAQAKVSINQPPLFDVFNNNGVSFGDDTVYPNTTFKGCKLFSYAIGTGANDIFLGFPISYNKISNLGDINFNIDLNIDSFAYGDGGVVSTESTDNGFVHQMTGVDTYNKKTGWVTAAAESVQYQVFNFGIEVASNTVTCDVVVDQTSVWQPVKAYVNGELLSSADYTITTDLTLNTTTITFDTLLQEGDGVSILLISNQVSKTAFYEVPTNLQNNPFNENMTTLTAGDIRRHYSTIFSNAPGVTGEQFGVNNINTLGNLSRYGTAIIHSSAPLALPGVFLRKPDYNIVDALKFNSIEYEKYKALLIETVYNGDYSVYQSPAQILDNAIYTITDAKAQDGSFFWSDMLPSGSPINTTEHEIGVAVSTLSLRLNQEYDFTVASYKGVTVYLSRVSSGRVLSTQLVKGVDYTIAGSALNINYSLLADDVVIVNEYDQTYGSYCPNTPTKLGMYAATVPAIVTDNTYMTPTTFIVGHDGSYTRLYGNYTNGRLDDFRDIVLFEFETRVYNNLKSDNTSLPLSYTDVFPGEFRTTDYTRSELLLAYSETFLSWVGSNRVDYKTQLFSANNKFTFNYNKATNRLNDNEIQQGYWRGIYRWLYDTTNPAAAPWEMLGLTTKPTWWDSKYGLAPYTSGNIVMWQDIADGYIWNNGQPYVDARRVRPQLLRALPVDAAGILVSPFDVIVAAYDPLTYNRSWVAGDEGPTESAYLRSSTWPFDLMMLLSISKPAKFYNFYADRDNYKYNTDIGQYLYNGRTHIDARKLEVYGNGIAKHSYINWVVDYINQYGIDGQSDVAKTIANIDVRLAYRVAGFTDKQYMRFYIEKSTPASTTPRLLIPDDSYDVLLYDNAPEDKTTYSSVIIQRTSNGYTVWGNSTTNPVFEIANAEAGPTEQITVNQETVRVNTVYSTSKTTPVAYGTLYYSIQGISEFLRAYGKNLENLGVVFDEIKDNETLDWTRMIKEFLNWAQQSWEIGSTISLNPSANVFKVFKEGLVVQPMTIGHENYVLNQNLFPIQRTDYTVYRNNEEFKMTITSAADAVAYTNLYLNSIEHAVVFNNTTQFNDTIYNLAAGQRQSRIVLSGRKTASWSGYVKTNGFILNENDVEEWSKFKKYTRGYIVTFKNLYYSALQTVEAGNEFDYSQWLQTDYEKVKTGLLPNPTTRAYEANKFYDTNEANLSEDEDLLSFGLIGFRPRQYLTSVELSDVSQINLYMNMIRNKGTMRIANAFKKTETSQGAIDYTIRENWAIRNNDFGAVGNNQFVAFDLNDALLTGNPALISFVNSGQSNAQQTVPLSTLLNYYNKPTSPSFLPEYKDLYSNESEIPTAGYVNADDIKISAYDFDSLNMDLDKLKTLYVGDYVWIANYKKTWAVFTPQSLYTTIQTVTNNMDNTVTVNFADSHGLSANDPIVITNFNIAIDGFYTVASVKSIRSIVISTTLSKTVTQLSGTGIVLALKDVRVDQASDLVNRALPAATKFNTRLSWADTNSSSDWQVWATGPVYKAAIDVTNYPVEYTSQAMGTRVAHTQEIGNLSTDATGLVYRNGVKMVNTSNSFVDARYGMKAVGDRLYCVTPGFGNLPPHRWGNGGWGMTGWDAGLSKSVYPVIKVYKYNGVALSLIDTVDTGKGITSGSTGLEVTDFAVSGDNKWVYIANSPANQVYSFKYNETTGKYDYANTTDATVGISAQFNVSRSGSKYAVSLLDPGKNYVAGDSIILYGSNLAGAAGFNDLTIYINSINSTGGISDFTFTGTPSNFLTATPIRITAGDSITVSSGWGNSIATNYDGSKVIIGAPQRSIQGIPSAGLSEIYSRASESIIVQSTTVFPLTTTALIAPASQFYYDIPATTVTGTGINEKFFIYFESNTTIVSVLANEVGTGYAVGNTLRIPATLFGAIPGTNDLTITVTSVSATGAVVDATVATPSTAIVPTDGAVQVLINGSETTAFTLLSGPTSTTITLLTTPTIGDLITINYGTLTLQQRTQRLELSGGKYVAQPENGALYGQSVTTNKYGAEMMVGCPFGVNVLVTNEQTEGAVYRWTNLGQRYGQVTANVTNKVINSTLSINSFLLTLTVNESTAELAAAEVARQINEQEPTNVVATASGTTLTISVAGNTSPGDILDIVGTSVDYVKLGDSWVNKSLADIGIQPYTNTQVIFSPDVGLNAAFGWSIQLNQDMTATDMLVVAAASTNGLINTVFDSSDNFVDDDTIFDQGATTFIDTVTRSGSVYTYDYLLSSTETSSNPGNYAFGQYCFDIDQYYDDVLQTGTAASRNGANITVAFSSGKIVIGTPSWYPSLLNPPVDYPNGLGRVTTYASETYDSSWYAYRTPLPRVDVSKINEAIIYDNITNEDIEFLDHIDPIQGKMLNVVETNLDYVNGVDPAIYADGLVWGSRQVGTTWLDTNNIRLINYHQTDIVYNAQNWGRVFPGSIADVLVWISSTTEPMNYKGNGYVTDFNKFVTTNVYDKKTDSLVTMYYFWVKGYDLVPEGKTLSPQVLSRYIIDPQSSGISYLAAISTDTIALYNCGEGIRADGSALHLGYATSGTGDVAHTDWTLIQEGTATEFLRGVPTTVLNTPETHYMKYLNSFMGFQMDGLAVPDVNLPKLLQHGTSFRPRQTMFTDRLGALKNYVEYANSVMIKYPLVETRDTFFIDQECQVTVTNAPTETVTIDSTIGMTLDQPFRFTGNLFGGLTDRVYYITSITGNQITFTTKIGAPSTVVTEDGTTTCNLWRPRNYITQVDWWATGYNSSTKPILEVPTYTELLTVGTRNINDGSEPLILQLYDGLVCRVRRNGVGLSETYIWKQATGWVRIGITKGTYQIDLGIATERPINNITFGWAKYGWTNVGWDRETNTVPPVPALEIYHIIRWITEQVFISELAVENNNSLMLMFNVVQSQSNQQSNYLPWLNKTSLIDVTHTTRNLLPYKRYQLGSEDLISGYINEVKPYHVYIKSFIYKYTGSEYVGVKATDFDLPSKYDSAIGNFYSPKLVSVATGVTGEYVASDAIWTDPDYADWFTNRNATNPELDPTRKIRVRIRFDRTSFKSNMLVWEDQFVGWDQPNWAGAKWSQVGTYEVGDLTTYKGTVYRAIVANSDTVFDASKWEVVQPNNTMLNSLDRILSFYKPTSNMKGFTAKDYGQLLVGSSYPNSTLDSTVVAASTYPWSGTGNVDIVNNTITVGATAATVAAGTPMIYVSTIFNGSINPGFGLANGNTYWISAVSGTELAAYYTLADAIADIDRIPLLVDIPGQFVEGANTSKTVTNNVANNPYWSLDGSTTSQGYAPEELVAGWVSDSVLVTLRGSAVVGSLSPVQNATLKIDSLNMLWKNLSLTATGTVAIIPDYSVDQILASNLPSTGVFYNGGKLIYGTDYTIEYDSLTSSKIVLTPALANKEITVMFYTTLPVEVTGITKAQYFDDSWF
jgi:hypothetical protein